MAATRKGTRGGKPARIKAMKDLKPGKKAGQSIKGGVQPPGIVRRAGEYVQNALEGPPPHL